MQIFIRGTTKAENQKLFLDKTKEFGLLGVQASHLYAVHLNKDEYVDLVLLPDHYSIPEFYTFNKKEAIYQNGA